MILVLPIHRTTPGLDTIARDLFLKKGKLTTHSLRVISTREDEDLAFQIADQLGDHFRKVTTQTLGTPKVPRNANQLANDMLAAAFAYHAAYVPAADEVKDPPLLYLDPTYRPPAAGWVDALQAEFFLHDAPPVMARTLTTGGGTTMRRVTEGPVVFGKSFTANSTLIAFLDGREHWRQRMCHEIAQGCLETKQIGNNPKSVLRAMKIAKV